MSRKSIRERKWYPYAVAACIAVTLYVALTHLTEIFGAIGNFFGFFKPVTLGIVIAYLVHPLARLLRNTLFAKIRNENVRNGLANFFTFILVLLLLIIGLMILVPELIESVKTFAMNLDGYAASLKPLLERIGMADSALNLDTFVSSSENLLAMVAGYAEKNIQMILSASVVAGKGVFLWVIAFFISIYILSCKEMLKKGTMRLLRALAGEERGERTIDFFRRCNEICSRYIAFNILDCVIVGVANAIFMTVTRMQYTGLVSFVVAIMNLVPTFGPVIGGAIGTFILLMVEPLHALMFLVFTFVLQTVDGYILKPRMYGETLGVPSVWILVGAVVGGRMLGIVGILIAIPAVAILDLLYRKHLLPRLERRQLDKAGKASEAGAPGDGEGGAA